MKQTLNELITKAYCMNLYWRADRWKFAQEQFIKNGLNVEKINAIDGREFSKKYALRPGNCGCNLTHMLIIQSAFIQGHSAIMVFEDDAVLADSFVEKMDDCLQDLPDDWDMLMLGASHQVRPEPVTDKIYRVKKGFTSHAYIMRLSIYELVLERLKAFDQPLDCIFTEIQQSHNVYITNPPMAWQLPGFSDAEQKVMNYDWLKTNHQL